MDEPDRNASSELATPLFRLPEKAPPHAKKCSCGKLVVRFGTVALDYYVLVDQATVAPYDKTYVSARHKIHTCTQPITERKEAAFRERVKAYNDSIWQGSREKS